MSYSGYRTSSAPSRGRGFNTRGSYRGRGGGGDGSNSSWNSTSPRGGRGGGFSGSRGRFNWYKEHSSSSFDSRRNYASGGYEGSSGADRYSSRGRTDDSYRRSYRGDVSDYSARDHSHHRSPESQRKRMRTEHSYVQASSGRRSHEGSYGGGTDYNSRYSYAEDKGYGEDRSRGYREERRSAGFRDRSREDYPHRKDLDSGMPPPSSGPPRHVSSPRGSFRGRLSSRGTRGMSRMTLIRRADAILSRKRSMMDSYSVRKRILTSRAQADSLRRLKIQKLRRMRELAAKKDAKGDKDGSGKGAEEISEDEEEEDGEVGEVEDWDAETKKDEAGEDGEDGEKDDKPKAKKKKKVAAAKDEEREEGEEIDEDDDEGDDDDDKDGDKSESPKKSETKSSSALHDSDNRAASDEGKRTTFHGKPFIRLTCPHCFMRCITFKEYSIHLYSSKHIGAMRKQSLRLKQTLARMRMTQRQKQRIVEESEAEQGSLSSRTRFCPVCKLNYRQFKTKHQLSDYHRAMKKFLLPFCRICRISFKSPMLFENHICSLDHIKREHWLKETKRFRDRSRDEGSGMDDEDKEVNLENFMTLDSVGTVDDDGEEDNSGEEGKSKSDKDKKEGDDKKRTEANLGSEYIKKVEVLFCEMCRTYLPRLDQPERALSIHCRSRPHLQRYVRYRDDRKLRREAERGHQRKDSKDPSENEKSDKKKEAAAEKMVDSTTEKEGGKDGEVEIKKEGEEADASKGTAGEESSGVQIGDAAEGGEDLDQELEAGMDDKLWADVDKDLGDLLREVEPGNKSSDEDEDSRAEGGRYDRFRYSEKGNSTAGPHAEGDAPDTTKAAVDGEGEGEAETETPEEVPAKDSKADDDKVEIDTQPKKQSPGGGTVSSTPVAVPTN